MVNIQTPLPTPLFLPQFISIHHITFRIAIIIMMLLLAMYPVMELEEIFMIGGIAGVDVKPCHQPIHPSSHHHRPAIFPASPHLSSTTMHRDARHIPSVQRERDDGYGPLHTLYSNILSHPIMILIPSPPHHSPHPHPILPPTRSYNNGPRFRSCKHPPIRHQC